MRFDRHHILAVTVVWAVIAADARGQINLPFGPANYEHDLQLFAPVELDLDNEPAVDDHGYFFKYDKLLWSYGGERVTVGDPNVIVLAEQVYRFNPADIPTTAIDPTTGLPFAGGEPAPYRILNGLQDVTPDAGFALGNRYEVGYQDRDNGWSIGILDGPELNQTQIYGISRPPFLVGDPFPEQDGDPIPPIDPDYIGPVTGNFALGFGNVHINFATPPGYLLGFRDYLDFVAGAAIGTQVGPLAYVGNYGNINETNTAPITFTRLTDDLNQNGINGATTITVVGPGGVLLLTTVTDFDDLHLFNVAFDQVIVRNTTETRGVEAMWTHVLTNRHYQAKHQNNHLELAFGARFLRLYDQFTFAADGGILGRTFSETSFTNQIVGPQVQAKWINQRQRWRLSADARFMFGYNVQDWNQINGIGEELVPGATNRLLYAQPTYSAHGLQQEDFSPVGELRVDAAYYLTQSWALRFGYTGQFVGNIRRAATSVRYFLPDMGYREAGTQDFLVNGFNFGVEFVH
jgi:hypothetical protein